MGGSAWVICGLDGTLGCSWRLGRTNPASHGAPATPGSTKRHVSSSNIPGGADFRPPLASRNRRGTEIDTAVSTHSAPPPTPCQRHRPEGARRGRGPDGARGTVLGAEWFECPARALPVSLDWDPDHASTFSGGWGGRRTGCKCDCIARPSRSTRNPRWPGMGQRATVSARGRPLLDPGRC